MLFFSTTLKTKAINNGEIVHLVGRNNWLQVKIVSVLLLILFAVFMIFQSVLFENIPIWVFILIVSLMFFFTTTSVYNLVYKRQSDALLTYLIFDRKGIRLNHKEDVKSEKKLPIKDVKRIRIVTEDSGGFGPVYKVYLNYRRLPFLEFKYKNENQFTQREVLDLFMHSLGLIFFQRYPLTRSRILYEYTLETELKKKERFSRKNFFREKSEDLLIFKAVGSQKHFLSLNLKDQILSYKVELFKSYSLKFSEVKGFDSSISFEMNRKHHSDNWMLSSINVTDQSDFRTNALFGKAPLEGGNYDILEFESLKEMDEIINEIKTIIGLKK